MINTFLTKQLACVAAVSVILFGSSMALVAAAEQIDTSENGPPANQKCPDGSYVIGFDSGSNIICSGVCGNSVLNAGEDCDDGNRVPGDGCSASCQSEGAKTAVTAERQAGKTPEPKSEKAGDLPGLIITDVEPSSVVFGSSEVIVTVMGSGFNESSVIIFEGKNYDATVNSEGTRLTFKPVISGLSIGSYALTVSNGSGLKVTRKRSLVVF